MEERNNAEEKMGHDNAKEKQLPQPQPPGIDIDSSEDDVNKFGVKEEVDHDDDEEFIVVDATIMSNTEKKTKDDEDENGRVPHSDTNGNGPSSMSHENMNDNENNDIISSDSGDLRRTFSSGSISVETVSVAPSLEMEDDDDVDVDIDNDEILLGAESKVTLPHNIINSGTGSNVTCEVETHGHDQTNDERMTVTQQPAVVDTVEHESANTEKKSKEHEDEPMVTECPSTNVVAALVDDVDHGTTEHEHVSKGIAVCVDVDNINVTMPDNHDQHDHDTNDHDVDSHSLVPDELRDSAIRTLVDSQSLLAHSHSTSHSHSSCGGSFAFASASVLSANGSSTDSGDMASSKPFCGSASHSQGDGGLLIVPPAVSDNCRSNHGDMRLEQTDTNQAKKSGETAAFEADAEDTKRCNAQDATGSSGSKRSATAAFDAEDVGIDTTETGQGQYDDTLDKDARLGLTRTHEEKARALSDKIKSVVLDWWSRLQDMLRHALLRPVQLYYRILSDCWDAMSARMAHVVATILLLLDDVDFWTVLSSSPTPCYWGSFPTSGQLVVLLMVTLLVIVPLLGVLLAPIVMVLRSNHGSMSGYGSDSVPMVADAPSRERQHNQHQHHRLVGILDLGMDEDEDDAIADPLDLGFVRDHRDSETIQPRPKTLTLMDEPADEESQLPTTSTDNEDQDHQKTFDTLGWDLFLHALQHSGTCDVNVNASIGMLYNCTLWNSSFSELNMLLPGVSFSSPLDSLDNLELFGGGGDPHTTDMEDILKVYSGLGLGRNMDMETSSAPNDWFAGTPSDANKLVHVHVDEPTSESEEALFAHAATATTVKGAKWLSDFFQKGHTEVELAAHVLHKTVETWWPTSSSTNKFGSSDIHVEEEEEPPAEHVKEENDAVEQDDDEGAVPNDAWEDVDEGQFTADPLLGDDYIDLDTNTKDPPRDTSQGNMADDEEPVPLFHDAATHMEALALTDQHAHTHTDKTVPSLTSLAKGFFTLAEQSVHKLGDFVVEVATQVEHYLLAELQCVVQILLKLAHTLGYEMQVDHILDGLHYMWTHVKLSSSSRRRSGKAKSHFHDSSWSAASSTFDEQDESDATWEEDTHTSFDGEYHAKSEASTTPDARWQ
jgi:hypothetical protein